MNEPWVSKVAQRFTRQFVKTILKQAAQIADERARVCAAAAANYEREKPSEPYWAASERCAQREAEYIAEKIRALADTGSGA